MRVYTDSFLDSAQEFFESKSCETLSKLNYCIEMARQRGAEEFGMHYITKLREEADFYELVINLISQEHNNNDK